MKINDIEIMDLCLYLRKERILVLADIHMGYEEAINKEGVLIPRVQYDETIKRLGKILSALDIGTIIINGDLKHEFGTISETEWRNTLGLLDFLAKYSKKIILIKGNHDTILKPIANKRNVKIKDSFTINDSFICHGHELRDCEEKIIIIGHEHPAVSLRMGGRIETYKCFLIGKFKGKDLIVMPSFNLVVEGTDVLKEELLSPYLQDDLKDFRVVVADSRVLDFGKVKNLTKTI